MNDEKRAVGEAIVHRYGIIGTTLMVYAVYEPSGASILELRHSTISSDYGAGWYGRVGTTRLPSELDALPGFTEERSRAVQAWMESEYQRAYRAILEAFPEADAGSRSMGEITMHAAVLLPKQRGWLGGKRYREAAMRLRAARG